jgi:signal transduction histidine kinase/CheY-like chemotaxis protein
MSLRLRLILMAGVCMLPSVLLLASTQWELRQARAVEVRQQVAELARSEASEIGTVIGGARQFLSALQHNPAVLQRNAPLCSAWLARLRRSNPSYASIRADDLTGETFCSSEPGRAGFDSNRQFFTTAIRRRGFAVGNVAVSPITHAPELPVASIVMSDEWVPADVLVVGLNLSWLRQDLTAKLPPDAVLMVTDRNGGQVLRADGSAGAAKFAASDPGGWIVSRLPVLARGSGLAVIAARPRQAVFATLDQTARNGVVLIALALLLACLAAVWIGRRFIQAPIRALLDTTRRLRDGDYTARVETADGASELAQLGRGLNALVEELDHRARTQAEAEDKLRQFAATLEERVAERTRALQEANRRVAVEAEERQRTQAELAHVQKLDAIGKLTGGIAHDFNNLLAAVLGSLEAALTRAEDARLKRLLNVATQAAQRGAKLTAHLLAFSRKQDLALKPVRMNAIIAGMDDLLDRTLGKSVRLQFDLSEDLWLAIGDPVQVEVSLLNLAINARDAMPEGGALSFRTRNVHVADGPRAGVTLPSGDYVMVAVIDAGEGMPPQVRAKAFEPFFTTKGPGKGTGLGLSMVYGFARQAGGTVTIDSTPGKGTAISLYLPRARQVAEIDAAEPAADTNPAQSVRVLLVDDDDMVRETTHGMLEALGHTVVEAATPEVALQSLRNGQRFDLLVADFSMPEMNGAQLTIRAHELRPGLPVLIVTGYAETEALNPAPRVWQVLQKPFVSAELADAVRASTADRRS